MASSKGVAFALLLFFALVLASVPSSSADKEKHKQCSKVGAIFHCADTLKKVALGKVKEEDCQGCCKYLKKVDASEAASCLCKAVPDKQKDKIADTLNAVLETCKIDCKVPAYYKCPKY